MSYFVKSVVSKDDLLVFVSLKINERFIEKTDY